MPEHFSACKMRYRFILVSDKTFLELSVLVKIDLNL